MKILVFSPQRTSPFPLLTETKLAHLILHVMSFITSMFHEILLSGFRGVALTRKTGLTD